MMLVNGKPGDRVQAADRGLLYGDGLFETLRLVDGCAPLWGLHLDRLQRACATVELPCPDRDLLWEEIEQCSEGGDGVVRLTVTRGVSERGYAPPRSPVPTRIVEWFPLPGKRNPLRVVWCEGALASGSPLAGIKHLSRIENVRAAARVRDAGADDGLLFDARGQLIEGIASNIFLHHQGAWLTPDLTAAGVAGVYRAWLLERCDIQVCSLGMDQVRGCEAMFFVNAVHGIMPVATIQGLKELTIEPVRKFERQTGDPWSAS